MKKGKNPCENCEYEQDVYCTSPIGRCVKEAKRERIHNIINDVIAIIAMIIAVIAICVKMQLF